MPENRCVGPTCLYSAAERAARGSVRRIANLASIAAVIVGLTAVATQAQTLTDALAEAYNRIDELTPAALREITGLVAREYPGVPLLPLSAKTGHGFDALIELLEQDGNFGRKILDIDYDTYAEGEAELGWLNGTVRVAAPEPFDLAPKPAVTAASEAVPTAEPAEPAQPAQPVVAAKQTQ